MHSNVWHKENAELKLQDIVTEVQCKSSITKCGGAVRAALGGKSVFLN